MIEADAAPLLEVEDLCIGTEPWVLPPLVRAVAFALKPGEIMGLVGQSGSGKTLTACALCALLPRPLKVLSGRISFAGRQIDPSSRQRPGFKRGGDILMLFHSPLGAMDPSVAVGNQIAAALQAVRRLPKRQARLQARELMELVGLHPDQFNAFPFQLSGGQRQRALLSIAFGLKPRVLIADEPTAGQDEENRNHIINLLIRLQIEAGVAAVIVSHDLRVLRRITQTLVVLYRGKQVEAGPSGQIVDYPVHSHTQELIAAMHFLEAAK